MNELRSRRHAAWRSPSPASSSPKPAGKHADRPHRRQPERPGTGTMPVRFPGRSSKKVSSSPEPEEKATAVVRAALSLDRSFPAETPPQSRVRPSSRHTGWSCGCRRTYAEGCGFQLRRKKTERHRLTHIRKPRRPAARSTCGETAGSGLPLHSPFPGIRNAVKPSWW